jgi:hypothetical protein
MCSNAAGVKYALDTNVYVDAFRDARAETAPLERALAFTYLSAVVMQELMAGARSPEQSRELERSVRRAGWCGDSERDEGNRDGSFPRRNGCLQSSFCRHASHVDIFRRDQWSVNHGGRSRYGQANRPIDWEETDKCREFSVQGRFASQAISERTMVTRGCTFDYRASKALQRTNTCASQGRLRRVAGEPGIARLALRRLVEPLTLWDESERPEPRHG